MSDLGNRLETPRQVERITVIRVVAVRGYGVKGDPVREVTQYWSEAGALLAESDPCSGDTSEPTP